MRPVAVNACAALCWCIRNPLLALCMRWRGWLTAIDMEEMFSAMAATGVFTVEEIRETFAAADVDRNAMLSFSEFKQFFKVTAMLLLLQPRAITTLTNTLRCCRMCLALRSCHGGTLRVRRLVHSAVHGCNGKGDVCFWSPTSANIRAGHTIVTPRFPRTPMSPSSTPLRRRSRSARTQNHASVDGQTWVAGPQTPRLPQ